MSLRTTLHYFGLIGLALLSSNSNAIDLFTGEKKRPSFYFSNDEIRHEEVKTIEQPNHHISKKHTKVADYFNSKQEPVATDAFWESEYILRIGVVRRSLADKAYAAHVCSIISSSGLTSGKMKVRIIYLPALAAFDRLELLIEHKCS